MGASKEYEQFIGDLEKSRKAVLAVASFFQGRGNEVILPAHKVTPSEKERYDYQDSGDLKVAKTHQIKHSSRDFNSVEEFGFKMITVDEQYKIDAQRKYPPAGYWIINKSCSGGIFIPWETNLKWDSYEVSDKTQNGRKCNFIRCPAENCRFFSFGQQI